MWFTIAIFFLACCIGILQYAIKLLERRVKALEMDHRPRLLAQRIAQKEVDVTGQYADDLYGNRWYPRSKDGMPICGQTPTV